jgi:riboflavin synthase
MFTGIIEAVGRVASREGSKLTISADASFGSDPLKAGESISVDGVCLTLLPGSSAEALAFEVSPETFGRSSLGVLIPGAQVNLERAVRASDRLGGHIVQGHVDCVGKCLGQRDEGEFQVQEFQAPSEYAKYLIDKGSVAVQGVSLTVVRPNGGKFEVWLVPHTLENTSLRQLKPGSIVNLEFDVLAKYVEKLLNPA